jgi:crotonobetainyl-CoA:carnitine CoA-transferase CaiB-like acyl-CoA transferase
MAAFAPLDGIRVLDFTTSIAGPWCTQILGALGADVLKIEHPDGGDDTRSWGPPFWDGESTAFLAMNANKRSVVLDLKSDEGRSDALGLADDADVIVENLRPGTLARLGLSFDEVSARNDRIVYCSIGAFGVAGPLKSLPGYDPLMQAASGIMSLTGEPDGAPVRAGVSVVDQGAGLWAVVGILSALCARERGAGAQLVGTSLYETALNWVPYQLLGYLATGSSPRRMGSALAMLAPYEAFATQDGEVVIAAANDRLFARLCDALGLPELATEPRFAANADRVANRDALHTVIADLTARATTTDLLERLQCAGVPAAPVQDIAQVASDPQTQALHVRQAMPHAVIDNLELIALPLSVNGKRVRHHSAPPAFGEHSPGRWRGAGRSRRSAHARRSEPAMRRDEVLGRRGTPNGDPDDGRPEGGVV